MPHHQFTTPLVDPTDQQGSANRYSTGLRELDERVVGLSPGELWVLTSAPGQGRSTLLTQLAVQAARRHGLASWLVSNRDTARAISARVYAQETRVPLGHIVDGPLMERDRQRLGAALESPERSPLTLVVGPYAADRACDELQARAPNRPTAVFFDDPEWNSAWRLHRARRLADSGLIVVATLPRHDVLAGNAYHCDLEPTMRLADLVVEVRQHNLAAADDDLQDEPGLAAIAILRSRRGPYGTLTVAFQGHFARFVSLRSTPGRG